MRGTKEIELPKIELPEIERTLHSVDRIARVAIKAVLSLYDKNSGTFWRSTEQFERDEGKADKFMPTVSYHCAGVLAELAAAETHLFTSDQLALIRDEVIPRIASATPVDNPSSLFGDEGQNLYTVSQYVEFIATSIWSRALPKEDIEKHKESLTVNVQKLADLLGTALAADKNRNGRQMLHPFLVFHAIRALQKAKLIFPNSSVLVSSLESLTYGVSDALVHSLAKEVTDCWSPSEAVALVFCAASMSVSDGIDHQKQYCFAALRACMNSQDSSGCWPHGRVIRGNKDLSPQRLEVSTFEVAWVSALAALKFVRSGSGFENPTIAGVLEGVINATNFTEAAVSQASIASGLIEGWCTEHPYGKDVVESWTSATVLQSAVASRKLLEEEERGRILSKYVSANPWDPNWPNWLKWESFKVESEIDQDFPILKYIEEKLVTPVLDAPGHLPVDSPRNVSALLFGPPGTSKTTIIKGVADALQWPMLFLSPGSFIDRGLELIEARAKEVFDDLLRLSRVIVIFDECDELFRDRKPSEESEQTRGITAFVTASMLPKLQQLHDEGRVLFFVCTNNFDTMDPAVKRTGRMDHVIGVGPPDKEARSRILRVALKQLGFDQHEFAESTVAEMARESEGFIRGELTRLAGQVFSGFAEETTESEMRDRVRNVVESSKKSLTIREEEGEKFEAQKKEFSHPVLDATQQEV